VVSVTDTYGRILGFLDRIGTMWFIKIMIRFINVAYELQAFVSWLFNDAVSTEAM
jgi:hypothetical protein